MAQVTDSLGLAAHSDGASTLAMAHPSARKGARRRVDLLTAAAVAFFLLAVVFAAAPAVNAGPATLAGLMLLIGLGGVACLGLFVLRGSAEPAAPGEPGENPAPLCVAKGLDNVALKIRAVAEAAGVPVIEDPPLARALYASVDLDDIIPPAHYEAVAKVIGFVLNGARRAVARPL